MTGMAVRRRQVTLTLCAEDEKLRVTKKEIPRNSSYVEVKRHDPFLPEEKEIYSDRPNFDSSLALVMVDARAYWGRLGWGNYEQLYIVSPQSAAGLSLADSDGHDVGPSTIGEGSEAGTARQQPSSR